MHDPVYKVEIETQYGFYQCVHVEWEVDFE